jgi:hypothetical protein
MSEFVVGDARFEITATLRGGRWTAQAVRPGSADRFGIECTGDSETDAIGRLERWLVWQSEHAAALEALQHAEQAYHRTLAGSAFTSPVEGFAAVELQKDSLDQVEAARVRLDEVRARRPN